MSRKVNLILNPDGSAETFFFEPVESGPFVLETLNLKMAIKEVIPPKVLATEKEEFKTLISEKTGVRREIPLQKLPQKTSPNPFYRRPLFYFSLLATGLAQVAFDKGIERYESETNSGKKSIALDFLEQSRNVRNTFLGLNFLTATVSF